MKKLLIFAFVLTALINIMSVNSKTLPQLDHVAFEVSPEITDVNGTLSIQTSAHIDGTC